MKRVTKLLSAAVMLSAGVALAGQASAQSASDLMMKALGTTEGVNPVLVESFEHAAMPLSAEQQELALKCWKDGVCETGHGELTVAYADGFGENVWRRVTAMEYIAQALTYPEVKKIVYTSARGDASKAIADMRAYIAQKVDVIVMFADAGEALLPVVKEATEAGILVTVHNGTNVGGEAGKDFVTAIAEDVCKLGVDFVKAVAENKPLQPGIVALGGTPGNPLSATWQGCADKEIANHAGLSIVAKADTNWTQEGNFEAVSGLLAQRDDIGAYIYEYADGFRGAVRAYESAGKPLDVIVALRTDEQGLFCDWEKANNPNFKIFYSSGQNFQSRFALTAALMKKAGKEVDANLNVPFKMKPVVKGLCNPELPLDASVSTLLSADLMKKMFAQ
ncbi:MAG: substrate-binding domain-containing protein [Rhizobiaceae bacterium]